MPVTASENVARMTQGELELVAGSVVERVTVGATVSFSTVVLAWVAAFPAASLWFAVMESVAESGAAATLTDPVFQVPPEQLGEEATPPMLTITRRPFSEQVPETA
jgi:hypothetical protein